MYIYVHAAFLLNFILKNISPKKLIKDGNWHYINKTHNPKVLTINGKAEAVILDPESYQKIVNKIALLESSHKIKKSLIEMENEAGIPAQKTFKKLRQKITKK